MRHLLAFLAGFLSTLLFHQGLMFALHRAGVSPRPAYVMTPTAPLQVPQVVSLAFWGGVWAVAMAPLLARWQGSWVWWVAWLVVGGIAPTVVAFFVVLPLKGKPVAAGWDPKILFGGVLVNAVWGVGTALLLRLLGRFGP